MKRGEAVRCTVDYDLFEQNIKDMEGCFVKYDETTEKCLIWFSCNGEWAELQKDQFVRLDPDGKVPPKYREFADSITTLEYSLPT